MLGLHPADYPLEILRLGYALKTVSVERIQDSSNSTKDPVNRNAIASALGMRLRSLRHDYVHPSLKLFGCTSEGFPDPELVHELFIHTRRSGSDEEVGPIISRWLRFQFEASDKVFVLPVSNRSSSERSGASWVFHSLDSGKISIVTVNSTKFYREHKHDVEISEYPFAWLKSLPGHFYFLTARGATTRPQLLSLEQIQLISPNASQRLLDCLSGESSHGEGLDPVMTKELLPVLKKIHSQIQTAKAVEERTDHGEVIERDWAQLQQTNLFNSRIIQLFAESGCFGQTSVQHEMLASLAQEGRVLENIPSNAAIKFLKSVDEKGRSSDEVTDALTIVLKRMLTELATH
jgi:hypothetical protein